MAPGALPENAAAARLRLAEGRPALVWRRLVADTETPVGAALKLIEPGRGDFYAETRRLLKWLKEPDVGLALDPEWRVTEGQVPGQVIDLTTILREIGVNPDHLVPVDRADIPKTGLGKIQRSQLSERYGRKLSVSA